MKAPLPLLRIFAWPLVLGIASLIGLISALTGDGLRNWISWLTLAAPVAAIGWAMFRRRQ